jgi:hypothetical protein
MKYAFFQTSTGDWFRHSEVARGIHRHTERKVITYAYFYFFKIRKVGQNFEGKEGNKE